MQKNSDIRVAFTGTDENFNASSVRSIDTAIRNLYSNMKALAKGMSIEQVIFKKSKYLGSSIPFMIKSLFYNFSNYDIIYNPNFLPLFPLNKSNAVTVAAFNDVLYQFYDKKVIEDMKSSIRGNVRRFILVPLGIESLKRMDYIIAVSTLAKESIESIGYDKNRIFVVSNGIQNAFIKQRKIVSKRDSFTVGYIGTFRSRKNVDSAIRAFSLIKDDNIKFELWGRKMFEYNKLVDLAKGNKNIKFMGPIPPDESKVVSTYDSFDLFVFPTLYDGFGLPIIEAQARGIPVVIYKYAMIAKEVRKYCIEAEDEEDLARIIEEIKAKGYSEKKLMEAMKYARNFTWERAAANTLKIFRKIA